MPASTLPLPEKPDYLQFYPTLRCNYACRFCFNRDTADRGDVRLSDFDRIASVAASRGIGHVDLLGGEPTLHPELSGLIGCLHVRGITATLSSNGSRIEPLRALSDAYGRSTLRIGISVNDPQAPEPLDRFIRAYRPMVKSLFSIDSLVPPAGVPYAAHPDIDYFLLYRDANDRQDLAGIPAFYEFYDALGRLKNAHPRFDGVFCAGFLPDTHTHPVLANVRCPAGTTKLSVLPDGSVYPCYLFFPYPEFELGNLLKDDFQTIWHHPMLDPFRKFEGNRCPRTGCALSGDCHGGCPAMAYRFTNDLGGPDPRCIPHGRP